MEKILPILDMSELETKTNEAAMKGALKCIEEYYSGYNSPFRKSIDEILHKQSFMHPIYLPDVIAMINDSLSKEIDTIANEAVAKTFIPLVRQILSREKSEITFSEFLKEFTELFDIKNEDDCRLDMTRNRQYNWYDIQISANTEQNEKTYRLTLHEDYDSRNKPDNEKRFTILSIPQDTDKHGVNKTMKLSLDGATLEMPFTSDILKDPFMSYCARLVMCKTKFRVDVDYFPESIFYNE